MPMNHLTEPLALKLAVHEGVPSVSKISLNMPRHCLHLPQHEARVVAIVDRHLILSTVLVKCGVVALWWAILLIELAVVLGHLTHHGWIGLLVCNGTLCTRVWKRRLAVLLAVLLRVSTHRGLICRLAICRLVLRKYTSCWWHRGLICRLEICRQLLRKYTSCRWCVLHLRNIMRVALCCAVRLRRA